MTPIQENLSVPLSCMVIFCQIKKWRFNVICDLHNHDMCEKLTGHSIACRLMPEEKEIVSDMTLNMVQPKNILATLKHKIPKNILNIKQV